MSTPYQLVQAEKKGRDAYRAGQSSIDNPYVYHSQYNAWLKGYRAAQTETLRGVHLI